MAESTPESPDGGRRFGDGDATHQGLGGVEGIRRLSEVFYRVMDTNDFAAGIRAMHPSDLTVSIDKLARFLSGWTGGPRLFAEKYGPIKIPMAHQHLRVDEAERDAWLLCMERALDELRYADDIKHYLLEELFVPAERVRIVSARRRAERRGESAASVGPDQGLSIGGASHPAKSKMGDQS